MAYTRSAVRPCQTNPHCRFTFPRCASGPSTSSVAFPTRFLCRFFARVSRPRLRTFARMRPCENIGSQMRGRPNCRHAASLVALQDLDACSARGHASKSDQSVLYVFVKGFNGKSWYENETVVWRWSAGARTAQQSHERRAQRRRAGPSRAPRSVGCTRSATPTSFRSQGRSQAPDLRESATICGNPGTK